MKCNNCNVEIIGKADICPLCKQKLEADNSQIFIYPQKQKHNKKYKMVSFSPLYIIIASIAFLITVAINMVYAPNMKWFWVVGIGLIYCYILVENTVLSRSTIAHKILWQAIIIFAFIWAISQLLFQMDVILDPWYWSLDIALTTVLGVSNFVMWILTACLVKQDKSLIIDCISFSITGFLPIILFAAGAIKNYYGATAVAITSFIQIVVLLIAGRKHLKKEGKMKYKI